MCVVVLNINYVDVEENNNKFLVDDDQENAKQISAHAQVMKEDSRENSLNFIVFLVSGVLLQPET